MPKGITVYLSDDLLGRLDKLKGHYGFSSRTEIITVALLEFFVKMDK